MQTTCKVLESDKAGVCSDFDALADLMSSRDSFLGVPKTVVQTHRAISIENARDLLRVGNSMGRVFALFDERHVMQAVVFTAISDTHPCYYVNKAYTRPGSSISSLATLFEYLVEHYERHLGYRRFYTMYRAQDVATYHRLWQTLRVLRNYVTYTDLEVEPNIRPKHSDYWELLFGRMLFDSTMVIRGFIKKTSSMFYNDPDTPNPRGPEYE